MRLGKVPYLRSLRSRALLVALASLAIPFMIVLGWLTAERGYERGMQRNAAFTAQEAREIMLSLHQDASAKPGETRCGRYRLDQSDERLRGVARSHRVRLKLLDRDGRECFEHDADNYVDVSQSIGSVVLGRPASTATAGPVPAALAVEPDDLAAARRTGSSSGCRDRKGDKVECYTLLALDESSFLLVEDSARRPASVLSSLEGPLFRISLFSAPFAIGLAWWMSRRLVKPIETLRDQVLDKAQAANTAPDLSSLSGNEVDDLTRSFNTLLRSLEQRREHESSMAADLVHELKNPLAAIRATGEALQKPNMEPERRAQLGRVLEQSSARLIALATEYLEMARAEARLPGEAREPVDLGALVRGVAESFRADERFAAIDISVSGLASAELLGIPHRLESVVRNLLENAACVSLPSGKVEATLVERGRELVLSITDSGPGIPEADLPLLFKRFYSSKRESGGTGLGLALSRAIVEAHGGSLRAENAPDGGAVFEVILQRA